MVSVEVPLNSSPPLTESRRLAAAVVSAAIALVLAGPCRAHGENPGNSEAQAEGAQPTASLSPYSGGKDELWNRVHRTFFVRTDRQQRPRVHLTDPLFFRGGTFLLKGEPHRRALEVLDELVAVSDLRNGHGPLERLFFQRDLWAAFDYAAWYPDDWVHDSKHEPAAVALRARLAKAIGKLSLTSDQINGLADNYAVAVESKDFGAAHDSEHPQRPFLPVDLFDPAGPWVRFHDRKSGPMTSEHFKGAGGRAVHIVFLRLPEGRAATERYLRKLDGDSLKQFPSGTMVAMVRRALAISQDRKVRVTSITELVQIRVYRRIPEDPRAYLTGDRGEQDVYEFMLDREELFAGRHGLRPVGADEPVQPFQRAEGDPFEQRSGRAIFDRGQTQLKSCIQCHAASGVYSVNSLQRGLRETGDDQFMTYDWDVELNYTVRSKVQRFDWGLLQGLLEAR